MNKPILKCHGYNDNNECIGCVEIYKDHTSPVGSFDFGDEESNNQYLEKFANGELTQYMACFRRFCKCCKQYGPSIEWLGAMHHTTSREAFLEYIRDEYVEDIEKITRWEIYENN